LKEESGPSEAEFRPWAGHRGDYPFLGGRPGGTQETRRIETAHTKAEVLEYREICRAEVEARAPALDLGARWNCGGTTFGV
jgi:hypothetical protein